LAAVRCIGGMADPAGIGALCADTARGAVTSHTSTRAVGGLMVGGLIEVGPLPPDELSSFKCSTSKKISPAQSSSSPGWMRPTPFEPQTSSNRLKK
jgi:hypothetical protein